jgi:hypothetical protein
MKNQLFTMLFLSVLSISAVAQSTQTTAPILDKACRCLEKIEYETGTHDIQAENCLLGTMTDHYDDLCRIYGFTPGDYSEQTGEELGMRFGLELIAHCPAFLTYSLKSLELSVDSGMNWDGWDDEWLMEEDWGEWDYNDPITATIQYVDRGGLFVLTGLDDTGLQQSFVVLGDFQGSEQLLNTNPVGKKFTFFYEEWEIYNPSTTIFEIRKVIYAIE